MRRARRVSHVRWRKLQRPVGQVRRVGRGVHEWIQHHQVWI